MNEQVDRENGGGQLWVKKFKSMNVEGRRLRERSRKTQEKVLRKDVRTKRNRLDRTQDRKKVLKKGSRD